MGGGVSLLRALVKAALCYLVFVRELIAGLIAVLALELTAAFSAALSDC